MQGAPGQVNGDLDRRPIRAPFKGHGQVVEVVIRIEFALPPIRIEVLTEVPLLVGEADGDEGHAKVRGRLKVVTCQKAQAARVDGHALGQAKLH